MSFEDTVKSAEARVLDNIPVAEPWLSRWCVLHMLHAAAISAEDFVTAVRLADQRYKTWLAYSKMLGRA